MSQGSSDTLQAMASELKEEEKRVIHSLILLNPDLLTTQYKNSKGVATEAESYLKAENPVVAKNRFESAAKLALYEGDLTSAKAYLAKAVGLDRNSPFSAVLNDFGRVSRYVVESYKKPPRVS